MCVFTHQRSKNFNYCRYLNDVYTLEIREGTSLQWVCPNIEGPAPCPRESHTSVTVGTTKLLLYGGMNGKRLGDVWMLDVGMFIIDHVTIM